MTDDQNSPDSGRRRGITFWQLMKSVLGAALGVQSEETRHRDFTHGNPAVYIIAGLVFTAIFVLVLVVIVQVVLSNAGM